MNEQTNKQTNKTGKKDNSFDVDLLFYFYFFKPGW